MAITLSELKEKVDPYRNTLVLHMFKVVRLVDVVWDEDDFYWVFDDFNQKSLASCLLDWIPLKGVIKSDEYDFMVSMWNMNNRLKAE